ncbi:SPFH domain-containing protein [Burkholderia sp. LMG 13014]|uniref:SPFH domain-containing protein n=1 Tax=Burkholderia sp. LMG 13014 TaxID=2709306 RepID=UPI001F05BBD5|nr:SPFH domain-containing protein [Burkholderia sp. LMG 13014]
MSLFHSHAHDHAHHGHGHDHHHHAHHGAPQPPGAFRLRVTVALMCLLVALAVASFVQVRAGEASVVTRFGRPVRVLLEPGLAWRLPAPIDAVTPVDLRLHTTSSGLQDVGTRDGLRIIVEAYVAWRVPADARDCGGVIDLTPEAGTSQIREATPGTAERELLSFNGGREICKKSAQNRMFSRTF